MSEAGSRVLSNFHEVEKYLATRDRKRDHLHSGLEAVVSYFTK